MRFGRIVLQVNTDRLTESDFSVLHHTFKVASIKLFHAEKCCHMVSTHAASSSTYAVP